MAKLQEPHKHMLTARHDENILLAVVWLFQIHSCNRKLEIHDETNQQAKTFRYGKQNHSSDMMKFKNSPASFLIWALCWFIEE